MPARVQWRVDDAGGQMIELHPRPELASPKSWVWVVAARAGVSGELWRMHEGHFGDVRYAVWIEGGGTMGYEDWLARIAAEPDDPACAAARGAIAARLAKQCAARDLYSEFLRRCAENPGHLASMESIVSSEIVDLVGVSRDLKRVLGRLVGIVSVLGWPQQPGEAAEAPVRLFRSVAAWLAARCAGAVLVGGPAENHGWLAGCDGGIVTDDIAHGQAIQKILRRPYEGPKVLVAA